MSDWEVFQSWSLKGKVMRPPYNPYPPISEPLKTPTTEELEQRYLFHAPKGDQGDRYEKIRNLICRVAKECVMITPVSKEQTRALNALDEAMFLFSSAIARNE